MLAERDWLQKIILMDVCENALQNLPDNIGQLTALKVLDLRSNKLQVLPDSFTQLIALEKISLYNNRVTVLPADFCKLKKLFFLSLAQNQLRVLPEDIGQLNALEQLYLNKNLLREVPESFMELTALKNLYLHNNQIPSMPQYLTLLRNLELKFLPQSCVVNTSPALPCLSEQEIIAKGMRFVLGDYSQFHLLSSADKKILLNHEPFLKALVKNASSIDVRDIEWDSLQLYLALYEYSYKKGVGVLNTTHHHIVVKTAFDKEGSTLLSIKNDMLAYFNEHREDINKKGRFYSILTSLLTPEEKLDILPNRGESITSSQDTSKAYDRFL